MSAATLERETILSQRDPRAVVHPKGTAARVLLVSVFGPFARDDAYGSRRINPMELYHNQVTREEGPFSLRMFHRSWGLMLIQANIRAPCTLLDFPTRSRFIEELHRERYDIIGISAIMPNVLKVQTMCALIRRYQPAATIVVGGHVANIPDLDRLIDADHIVRGEGVRWFRSFLGQSPDDPIRHPLIPSGIGARCLGTMLPEGRGETAATLIPSVGCPMGCNFCCTSAMFGGKGRFINFYKSGDELFEVMVQIERALRVRSFFVMDENFLLHRKRALRLLELMERYGKSWALYVFSSANVLQSYTTEELVRLGISWVWMGIEGKDSRYAKLKGIDTLALVRTLQSHGVCVLGSSIIGLPEHAPQNIDRVIDDAVEHATEFHQFMLYTPFPGTPLGAEHQAAGTLLSSDECPAADVHGQSRFNFRHPHITNGEETAFLVRAFRRDFETNGPSVLRLARTRLAGWRRYSNHPDARIRSRYRWECRSLATTWSAALWAARRWFADHPTLADKLHGLLQDIHREFGLKSRIVTPLVGRILLRNLRAEAARQSAGWTYEPPTFYEKNHNGRVPLLLGVAAGHR